MTAPDREEIARLSALADWQRGELDRQRGQAATRLVLLFTDELIERRDQTLDDAIAHLAGLTARAVSEIGQFADHLLASAPSNTGDDTCLVAVRIR